MLHNRYFEKKLCSFFSKLFVGFALFSLTSSAAKGQTVREANDSSMNVTFNKTFMNDPKLLISVIAGLTQKAKVKTQGGEYVIQTKPQQLYGVDISYRSKIGRSKSLITGVRGMVLGRNASFNAPIKEINPRDYKEPFPPLESDEFDVVLSLPILFEKNWNHTWRKTFFVQGGIALNYSLGYDIDDYEHIFTDTNNNKISVFSLELNSSNKGKPWISYLLGYGCALRLKNYNILRLSIIGNLSLSRFVNGTYRIDIPGHSLTNGSYASTGSYIGLSISYGFTGMNMRLVKNNENLN